MHDFTRRTRKIINEYAPFEAKRMGHKNLSHEHILLGMIRGDRYRFLRQLVVGSIFSNLRVDVKKLADEVEKRMAHDSSSQTDPPPARDFPRRIIEASRQEARQLRHGVTGSEHMLLALLSEKTSIVSQTLADFGISYKVVCNEVIAEWGITD
jgi:ATP-dependent Clp protease ATP-binding subunit ClpC